MSAFVPRLVPAPNKPHARKPMTAAKRFRVYMLQTAGGLTPRQGRRMDHKVGRYLKRQGFQ